MSHNPNTVKSQDELNEGGRKSDVLLSAIDELEELRKENEGFERLATNLEKDCELLQKQLDIAVKALKQYVEAKDMYLKAQDGTIIRLVNTKFYVAKQALKEIEALNEIHKQE